MANAEILLAQPDLADLAQRRAEVLVGVAFMVLAVYVAFESVRTLLTAGRVKEAEQACRAQPSFLSFVILNGLAELYIETFKK